ncbi:MAG: CBS domain-containing protein [bacterium]|nr:CBS domain-containing protein [bacterium]
MLVRDRMSSPAITVETGTSLAEALGLMRRLEIRRLPVLQRRRLVGIVTWTDLMRAQPSLVAGVDAEAAAAFLERTSVREIMSPTPMTIGPDAPIEAAAVIMRREKIGGLPVVEKRSLLGMVTESDIFEAFIDLTGLRQGGARLVVDLSGRVNAIAGLASIADGAGVPLDSLATYQQCDRRLAVLRVAVPYPLHLVEALTEGGFSVLHLAAPPSESDATRGKRRYSTYSRAWESAAR